MGKLSLTMSFFLSMVLAFFISCSNKHEDNGDNANMVQYVNKKKPDIILSFIRDIEIESEYVVDDNMLYDSRFLLHKRELALSSSELKKIKQMLSNVDLNSTYIEKGCLYPYELIKMGLADSTCMDTIEVIVTGMKKVKLTVNDKLVYVGRYPNSRGRYNDIVERMRSFLDSLFSTNRVKHYDN